jgi:hypothetical protein
MARRHVSDGASRANPKRASNGSRRKFALGDNGHVKSLAT